MPPDCIVRWCKSNILYSLGSSCKVARTHIFRNNHKNFLLHLTCMNLIRRGIISIFIPNRDTVQSILKSSPSYVTTEGLYHMIQQHLTPDVFVSHHVMVPSYFFWVFVVVCATATPPTQSQYAKVLGKKVLYLLVGRLLAKTKTP